MKNSIIAVLVASALTACSQTTPQPDVTSPVVAEPEPTSAQTGVTENDPESPLIAKVVTQAIVEDAPVFPDISKLNAVSSSDIRRLMGDPDLYRKDGNIEIMLFENTHCVLEVVLSNRAGEGDTTSERVSTRTLKGAPTEGGPCLKTLLPGGTFPD